MHTVGVICEYNPFHKGHAWMLEELRRRGAEHIVCAMSGNFVQRGEAAIADKRSRAEMAVRCGADVVLELPTAWAASTAEIFARGGVSVLAQTGVVDTLAFGSEAGEAAPLLALAQTLESDGYQTALRRELLTGDSFATCRQRAVASLLGEETAELLQGANNNLGVEYCRAACGRGLEIATVERVGARHDGEMRCGIASASEIRRRLWSGDESALELLPPEAAKILSREMAAGRAPVSLKHCERSILARLRQMEEEDFHPYDGGGEGLYHRLYDAVRQGGNIEAILESAKTKRYSHARLRRMVLAAWLGLETATRDREVPYLRLLAAGERGRPLLRRMRDSGAPLLTKAADVAALGAEAEALLRAEAAFTDLYTLAYPTLQKIPCGSEWRITPVI